MVYDSSKLEPISFRSHFYTYSGLNNNVTNFIKSDNKILRIMTFNVYMWKNPINIPNFDKQLSNIKLIDPDILMIQEATWDLDFDKDEKILTFKQLGYKYIVQSQNILENNVIYGNLLISKIPFKNQDIIDISLENYQEKHACIHIELDSNIHIFGTHLDAIDNSDITRTIQLENIFRKINSIDSPNIILLGDLNLLYKQQLTPEQWNLQIKYDKHRNVETKSNAINTIINNNFVDSFDLLNKKPPSLTCCYDRRVDYIFIKKNHKLEILDTQDIISNVSDHYPLIIDLKIPESKIKNLFDIIICYYIKTFI